MNLTFRDLLQSTQALVGFSIFFLPPGYLLASLTQIANFRTLSLPERFLWAVSLSTPLAIFMSVFLGRHTAPSVANAIIYLCGTAFMFLFLGQGLRGHLFRCHEWDRPTRITVLCMVSLAAYVLLATVGIQVGHRLFEPVAVSDWSVRVPLVSSAIHNGVPPANPFYGINGQTFHLRYYYYWYVLCGQMGRILHTTPRALLTASAAWSGIALLSVLFLYFKYLFQPRIQESNSSIRHLCLLSLPVSCIIGLDIIPAVLGALMHPVRVFPEMDWWRGKGDFSPSFYTIVLYGPHHVAGLVCGLIGFLVLTLCVSPSDVHPCSSRRRLFYGLLAGIFFAAAVGTATYITLFFVVACILFVVERTWLRDWTTVAALAVCGITALSLSWGYIHEIMNNPGTTERAGQANRFLAVYPRNWTLAYYVLHMRVGHTAIPLLPHLADWLLRIPIWIALFGIEVGFFGFVLAYRLHTDWSRRANLSSQQRFQWILCAAFGFCGLFLTSSSVIGFNDLGRHAGLALRFIAVLWATPLIARWLWSPEPWPLLRHIWLRRIVLATIVLGLVSQLWQIVLQRTYLMIVDSNYLVARPPFPTFRNIGHRYFQTRQAFNALDQTFPANAPVQYNPRSEYWALMTIYLDRPVAAGEKGCMTPFGGDAGACAAAMPALQALFGGSHFLDNRIAFDPNGVTRDAFEQVCSQHHLVALVATASDRVWPEKNSWVWNEPVLYANSSIRVLACPKIN